MGILYCFNGHHYEVLNPRTKKAKYMLASAMCPSDLFCCYARPSRAKCEIFEYWNAVSCEMNGRGYGVATYNHMAFTVTWNTEKGVYYITRYHNYFIPYAE